MNPEENGKSKLFLGVGVAIVVIAGLYFLFKYYSKSEPQLPAQTLGEQISGEVADPTSAVPDVNPYEAETNPFEKANPLKDAYKNPFE